MKFGRAVDSASKRKSDEPSVKPAPGTKYGIPDAIELPAMKTRGKFRHGHPEGVIVHFTAGRPNAKATIEHGVKQGYAYDAIDPEGQLFVAHPLNEWGYHAGKSTWPGLGSGVSEYLRGIENCCAGRLERVADGKFKSWFGEIYGRDEVRWSPSVANIVGGYYHKFSEKQEARLIKHILTMKRMNPAVFSLELVLGHDEVSPGRKNDPGASLSMTMPAFRKHLNDLWLADTKIIVP